MFQYIKTKFNLKNITGLIYSQNKIFMNFFYKNNEKLANISIKIFIFLLSDVKLLR